MAFPEGWGRRCELVAQSNWVPENLTNFPILFTVMNLPPEMFDADGSYPALSGGGDIRFSSDQAGTSRLACEIVTFTIDNDPANGVAEIWVNVPSVSSSVNTSIWVWYDKDGESQPARDAPYGMEATWNSDFVGVWHFNEASGAAKDSTLYNTDAAVSGAITREQPGKIGYSYYSDGTTGDVDAGDPVDGHLDFGTGGFTLAVWMNNDDTTAGWELPCTKGQDPGYRFEIRPSPNNIYFQIGSGGGHVTTDPPYTLTFDEWVYWVAHCDRGTDVLTLFKNAVNSSTVDISGIGDINCTNNLIFLQSGLSIMGWMDEIQISKIARDSGWVASSYNNQNNPATFVIEQTPESPGGVGVTVEPIDAEINIVAYSPTISGDVMIQPIDAEVVVEALPVEVQIASGKTRSDVILILR